MTIKPLRRLSRAPYIFSLIMFCACVAKAQSLPPAAPTTSASQTQEPAAQPPAPATLAERPATPAHVLIDGRQLTITAENSSLNGILREIAGQTGMRIIGGVREERVFGAYGPAPVEAVLMQLLDGTGTNVILLEDKSHAPLELQLTPRGGGPSPPSPTSDTFRPRGDRADRSPGRPERFPGRPTPPVPETTVPSPPPAPPAQAAQAPQPATPAPADTTTQQSPNGVKTPEQIYQQLMQMQQKTPKQ